MPFDSPRTIADKALSIYDCECKYVSRGNDCECKFALTLLLHSSTRSDRAELDKVSLDNDWVGFLGAARGEPAVLA